MDEKHKTSIGKDVIESLTLGMYDDPRFIFREYIQNSADQIDQATRLGYITDRSKGEIWIQIECNKRRITIEDNATGIQLKDISNKLKDIAKSPKKKGEDKGFRGIGRLGGLAYCEKLIFTTSHQDEDKAAIMTWDANKLRDIIDNRHTHEEASEVIDTITSLEIVTEKANKRYFKVTLENVTNDILLDIEKVKNYLSMVAPVPYHNRFLFRTKIHDYSKKVGYNIDEYKIYLNTNQLFKDYTTSIYENEEHNRRRIDEIFDIKLFNKKNKNGELVLWGWYSLSNFEKQMQKVNLARGIRLRCGNIQIGDEGCLNRFHKEQRGNFYFFGEIFAVHHDLIPNARRDFLICTSECKLVEDYLTELFGQELYELYRFGSELKTYKKRLLNYKDISKTYDIKKKVGFTNKEEKEKFDEKLDDAKETIVTTLTKIDRVKQKISENDAKQKLFDRILAPEVKDAEKNARNSNPVNKDIKLITDALPKLSTKEKRLLTKIFGIIDKVLTAEMANLVKVKISEEFK